MGGGGHAETQGFAMVFEGSQGQPVRMCGMHDLSGYLIGHITKYLLFCGIVASIYAHAAQWVFSAARRAPRGRCSENACSHTR